MKRKPYFILILILLLAEVYIGRLQDTLFRPYIGDILILPLAGCVLRLIFPDISLKLASYLFLFGTLAEGLQYIRLADILHIKNSLLRVLMGSTFDIRDIICYGIGCLLFYGLERKLAAAKKA